MLFDPVFQEDILINKTLMTNQIVDSITRLDMTSSYPALLSTFWNSGMPCTDSEDNAIMKYCEWKGLPVSCSAIFSTFPTDLGMCCTFNMRAAEQLFLGATYSNLIQNLQYLEKHKVQEQLLGNLTTEPGKHKGLIVVLDSHSDVLSASSIDVETKGFVGLITQGGNFPQKNLGGFDITSGHKHSVALSATIVKADDALQGVNTDSRNRSFEWENSLLRIYKYYTQSNCIFECNLFYVQDQLNQTCTPWYFPTPENHPTICDPWQAVQIIEAMSNVPKDKCNRCLPDCESTILKGRISSAPLRKCQMNSLGRNLFCKRDVDTKLTLQFLAELLEPAYRSRFDTLPYFFKNNYFSPERKFGISLLYGDIFESTNKRYNALDQDIAEVEIFFETPYALELKRSCTMNWIDYFSNVGGIYGLVLGMGIISFIELFWFFL